MALTNEDLLAISNLLDAKLKPIETKVDKLTNKVTNISELREWFFQNTGKVALLQ